jgi:hypothetical protein
MCKEIIKSLPRLLVGILTLILFFIVMFKLDMSSLTSGEHIIIILLVGYGAMWGILLLNKATEEIIDILRCDHIYELPPK